MVTVTVTMLQTRQGEDGALWLVNTRHSASRAFADFLIGNGFASGELPPRLGPSESAGLVVVDGADLLTLGSQDSAPPAGVLVMEPDTRLLYGQSDGVGGQRPVTPVDPANDPTYAAQLSVQQRSLPSITIGTNATTQLYLGPCAVAGVYCVTVGSAGSLTIHDDTGSTDATKLRFSRAYTAMTAATYYPMVADDPAAMLFSTGVYVTVPTSGLYLVDVVDGSDFTGARGQGMLCDVTRVTASGVAVAGPARVLSVKVIAAGSAGSLAAYNGDAVAAADLIYPSTAYTSLAADQIIRMGPRGGAAGLRGLYLTMPTNAVVLVNHLPR